MDAHFQPKLIYLARRHPSLDPEAFIARWRQHGALGMSLPRWRNIARYVHCDVAQSFGSMYYDAVGLIWHRSTQARAAHLADTSSRQQMEEDERATFAEPIAEVCLLAREIRSVNPPESPTLAPCKVIRFLRAPSRERLQRWRDDFLENAAPVNPIGRVLNFPLPPERGDRWGLDVDLVEELWFEDPATAIHAARQLCAPDAVFETCVLTNEVQLYAA